VPKKAAIRIFSGEGVEQIGVDKAIKALSPGDVLVLAEWDGATRSMFDGVAIMERVHERGATIKALDRQFLDLRRPSARASWLSYQPLLRTSASAS
jgi:DNA invertase Pin-like site-specific DNA recombinase